MLRFRFVLPGLLFALALPSTAQNVLNNGPGPGTLSVTMDGWGMWGGCTVGGVATDLMWTNTLGGGPFPTSCASMVILKSPTLPAPGLAWIATNQFGASPPAQATNPPLAPVGGNPRHLRTVTPQVIGGLSMVIEHKLGGPDPQSVPPVEGSTITQTYTITNTTANPVTFSLVRHIDVDLGPVGGPGSYWTNDRAGASRQLADCSLGAPPFTHNKEWAFVYDTAEVAATVVAIGVEGLDHTGAVVRVFNLRTNGNTTGHPEAAFLTDPVAFTNGAVTGDTDGNLLVDEGTGADQALNNGVTFTAVPNGGTVKAIFSTRLSAMNSGTATPVEQQARDITCSTKNGNYSGAGAGPLLCVNGSGGGAGTACVNVPTGMAVNLQMHAPAGGPNPTHYILYAGLGEPQHGSGCGSPQAHDFAVWGGGIAPFGLGSFPVTSVLGNWTGGNAVPGFALVSSIPGVALLLGPPASGAACPGTTVFSIPGVLPDGFSFTAQAVAVDFGVIGTPVSVSNAVTVAVGSCGCQSH